MAYPSKTAEAAETAAKRPYVAPRLMKRASLTKITAQAQVSAPVT